MDEETATLARTVAAAYGDPQVGREVERLIRSDGAPPQRMMDPGVAIGIGALIINVIQVFQSERAAKAQRDSDALLKQLLRKIEATPGVSDETVERIVRLAIAEARENPPA